MVPRALGGAAAKEVENGVATRQVAECRYVHNKIVNKGAHTRVRLRRNIRVKLHEGVKSGPIGVPSSASDSLLSVDGGDRTTEVHHDPRIECDIHDGHRRSPGRGIGEDIWNHAASSELLFDNLSERQKSQGGKDEETNIQ